MSPTTTQLVRNILALDGSISSDAIEKTIAILNGEVPESDAPLHALKIKEVAKYLGVTRRTIENYVQRGLLEKVYSGRQLAIGISRDSYLRLQHQMAGGKSRPRNNAS